MSTSAQLEIHNQDVLSTSRGSKLPPAVIVGLDCATGLQTARILAGHGIPVVGIAKDPKHPCCRTNVCETTILANTGGEELIDALERAGPRWTNKAVLYPCTDLSVRLISQYRDRLQEFYHVVLPEAETVEMLIDKIRFYTYAQQNNLPIPATIFLRNREDLLQVIDQLRYPCILKPPLKTAAWENSAAKLYKVHSASDLLKTYDHCSKLADLLMVQEWIPGDDTELYSCNCYFDSESNPIATFIARKIRQWPPEIGISSLGEECRNDIVLQQSIDLFQRVGMRGLCYLEMKHDARTGKHYIIEPNIGRPTGRSAIAEAGGVNILYAKYCDTIGLPLPPDLQQQYQGVKWVYFRKDLQSAYYYWRKGELSVTDWLKSLRGLKKDAMFSWKDPLPFLVDIERTVRRRFQRNGRQNLHRAAA
jgi:D-aspartate ligase